ncbi:MAG TPA: hypothetical protein VI731_12175 [Bacteroidia bacterium]|nr:hypothetical protein [Bacteroidia bacterium]
MRNFLPVFLSCLLAAQVSASFTRENMAQISDQFPAPAEMAGAMAAKYKTVAIDSFIPASVPDTFSSREKRLLLLGGLFFDASFYAETANWEPLLKHLVAIKRMTKSLHLPFREDLPARIMLNNKIRDSLVALMNNYHNVVLDSMLDGTGDNPLYFSTGVLFECAYIASRSIPASLLAESEYMFFLRSHFENLYASVLRDEATTLKDPAFELMKLLQQTSGDSVRISALRLQIQETTAKSRRHFYK